MDINEVHPFPWTKKVQHAKFVDPINPEVVFSDRDHFYLVDANGKEIPMYSEVMITWLEGFTHVLGDLFEADNKTR